MIRSLKGFQAEDKFHELVLLVFEAIESSKAMKIVDDFTILMKLIFMFSENCFQFCKQQKF